MKLLKHIRTATVIGLTVLASQSVIAKDNNSLDTVLASQDEKAQARYQYRNPKQTLEFFGIKPGMKVLEASPGGGWYTKILLPYLGKDGHLTGVDYDIELVKLFGWDEERVAKRKSWTTTWPEKAQEWGGEHGAKVDATTFGSFPADQNGTYDAVLFFRAMHGLARNESKGQFLTKAIKVSFDALKPGGTVGIVQHQAREDRPDEWANGSNGYLKQSFLVKQMEAAGFKFVGSSDINQNEKDQAGEGDFVWRLPPSLSGAKDDEAKAKAMKAIGESNRMTLKFVKPE